MVKSKLGLKSRILILFGKMALPVLLSIILLLVVPSSAHALDGDHDGLSDFDEINVFSTDPNNQDTDNDGFKDWFELNKGFSPLNPKKLKLCNSDTDKDGLSDADELKFHTNLKNPDTDSDGHKDGEEVNSGYDPLKPGDAKLPKKVIINTKKQTLDYYLGTVRLGSFKVSTGKAKTPTPKGEFRVSNKSLKAWSKPYRLWMPYWVGLGSGKFGIHELPIWPGGKREGANHLGIPVSHGCIRLGIGPAKIIYNWIDPDTKIRIE
jgi:hypothetical protein